MYRQRHNSKPENREKNRAYLRAYAATPVGKAKMLATGGKRRAIKQAAPIGDTKKIAEWVEHWKSLPVVFCHWCIGAFKPEKCHADHIMPLARGGAHSRDNMVVACAKCNQRKRDKHPDEWVKELESA